MHDPWTRQMNFVKLHSKIHSSFPFLVSSSFSSTSSLSLFSSSGCQMPIKSQNQVKIKQWTQKQRPRLMSWSIKWKGWYCSFLMVCKWNTVWCLELNYGAVGKGRTEKDYSRLAAIWRRGRNKAKRVGLRGTEGRPGKKRKRAIHWRYEKKYVVCLLMA